MWSTDVARTGQRIDTTRDRGRRPLGLVCRSAEPMGPDRRRRALPRRSIFSSMGKNRNGHRTSLGAVSDCFHPRRIAPVEPRHLRWIREPAECRFDLSDGPLLQRGPSDPPPNLGNRTHMARAVAHCRLLGRRSPLRSTGHRVPVQPDPRRPGVLHHTNCGVVGVVVGFSFGRRPLALGHHPPCLGLAGRVTPEAAALSGVAVALMGGVNATVVLAVLPVGAIWLLTRQPGPRRRALMGWWSSRWWQPASGGWLRSS